jgi:hypothetical protein
MYANLQDALQFKNVPGASSIIDEVLNVCPEFTGVDTYNGGRKVPLDYGTEESDTMETLFMTSAPTTNPYRDINVGVLPNKGVYEKRLTQLVTATAVWGIDKAIVERRPKEAAVLIEQKAKQEVKSHIQAHGKQFFYGKKKGGYAEGFPGLIELMDSSQVVSAGGTGAKLTSAYFVWFNEEGVSWRFGLNGSMTMSDLKEELIPDPNNPAKSYPGFRQYMQYHLGLKVSNKYSVARIANIDCSSAYSGDNLAADAFTDKHIYKLLTKLPGGMKPNAVFLPYVAALLLAASRTTVNIAQGSSGAPVIVGGQTPPVTEFEGIPCIPTDSITIGETPVSA